MAQQLGASKYQSLSAILGAFVGSMMLIPREIAHRSDFKSPSIPK